jgi:hypothetical protein
MLCPPSKAALSGLPERHRRNAEKACKDSFFQAFAALIFLCTINDFTVKLKGNTSDSTYY